jgi:ABC-type transport system involved in multi-copper enzyme maturation permease subunit
VIVKAIGAAFLIFSFWAVFGFALATLFRQSALAIGLGLAYALVIELLVFGLLAGLGGNIVKPIQQWFPIANSGYLSGSFGQVRVRGLQSQAAPYADATHAVVMLLIYIVAFTALSAWLTRSRDVTS